MNVRIYEDLEQGSESWLAARCGLLTASTIGRLITPTTLKVADNETSRGLTMQLAAERITGHVDFVYPTEDMQRGTDDEPFARDAYAEHFAPVEQVGFMVRDFGSYKIGYSPDGLVGDDGLIEIKSRRPKEHLKTVLKGLPPLENMAQMHAGMLVSDRDWCDYVSYSAGLPLWVKRVHPDQRWTDAIHAAAETFEINVTNIVNNFTTATAGLPMTERRASIEEITF
ncbi:lambda exonuclease family protein [Microbacterium sp. p3-SID131]|uniref:lambda exonuclease family protein n=1 Tax=Microbacterium sp. p3-SID131 TaxID=2916215 RepID=UPI0021A2736F|nr:lambda exonuclease family protein [Microbacterium sp. p3-SID131]MCT1363340.1 YqaJ viral recombinase family protein [Microbacterium sp. p3-SID131]